MRSEGFPFSLGVWGLDPCSPRVAHRVGVASSSGRPGVVNSVSMGEAAKPLLFEGFQAGCHVVLHGRHGTLWHSNLLAYVPQVSKLEDFSHVMLVLLRPRVSSRVSGFPVASPCLWGKLQNISFSKVSKQVVMSFCMAGMALCDIPTCLLTCRKCQNWKNVSHEMLVLLRPRVSSRVSGFPVASPCLWGKLQNISFSKVSKQVVMSFCVAGVALCDIPTCLITCRKCQNWRMSRTKCSFCCAHVSRLESLALCLWGKLQNLSFSKVSKQVVMSVCRRKFRSQTSDNMDRWKAEQERGREKRKIRRKKSIIEEKEYKKKEDADAWKGRKVAKHCVFPMIWGSGWSKSRLAKAAGAEPAGQMRDEKLHAVVARSTFRSQNVENAPAPDHFWQLRCRKSARRCGAKHISKSKCTKHTSVGPLLEVAMSKKCTPLWREAHFEVKMYKTHRRRTTFGSCDVEKVHAVVARSTFRSQNVENAPASDHFWQLRCRKSARRCGAKHISKSKC